MFANTLCPGKNRVRTIHYVVIVKTKVIIFFAPFNLTEI